ncbi:MAG TPA: ribonuclease HII [Rectinema sp.]|jgi:ribonuclease HII|nr:ribonuclease HII [Rectinema sp.]HOO02039.1 ribonuclease HII [Rectinema sp.]HOU60387.1 ribonuclease HII [Rectinema sp.]HQG14641.1 ribonuclease HII [Rectinema sp.]HQH87620.1 ribonuclease HII [Rectinema sp.]
MKKSMNSCTLDSVLRIPIELVCGVDEAGRGPLAGPVAAAAVILPKGFPIAILDDSKRMSARRREEAYCIIVEQALDWAVGWATVEEIEKHNILMASLRAMERAFGGLSHLPALVVVDGLFAPSLSMNGTNIEAATMAKADGLIPAVMAASILAKVARDRLMDCLDCIMPEYGFRKNKGYPTKAHRAAIERFGPSRFHRKGFQLLIQSDAPLFDSLESPAE